MSEAGPSPHPLEPAAGPERPPTRVEVERAEAAAAALAILAEAAERRLRG